MCASQPQNTTNQAEPATSNAPVSPGLYYVPKMAAVTDRLTVRHYGRMADVKVYANLVTVKQHHRALPTEYLLAGETPRIKSCSGRTGRPIIRFSKKSRNNMQRRFAMIRETFAGGNFITLTYPGEFTFTPEQVKTHLATFRKRVERRFPDLGAGWKLELKTRLSGVSEGVLVPHFHMLLTPTGASLPEMIVWVSEAWNEIVAPGDAAHLAAGTNVRTIVSERHAQNYLNKYVTKTDEFECNNFQTFENCNIGWGRRWGFFGALDMSPIFEWKLTPAEFVDFKRMTVRWLKSRGSRYARRLAAQSRWTGFSVFGLGDKSNAARAPGQPVTAIRMILSVERAGGYAC